MTNAETGHFPDCEPRCFRVSSSMSEIYLYLDGEQKGPYAEAEIRNLVATGLSTDTPAWHAGLSEWSTIANLGLSASVAPPVPPPVAPPTPPLPQVRSGSSKGIPGCWLAAMICGGLAFFGFFCLAGIAMGPIKKGIEKANEMVSVQKARMIGLAMFEYAGDHDGAYPDGRTSTEVFQKLLDGKYITDPGIFYFTMPGKFPALSGRLSAENVCYDVTSGITKDSSSAVPIVFSEGYHVTYASGATAEPDPDTKAPFPGIAVAYKNNSARFLDARPDGTVPDWISFAFISDKKTYGQLKP